MRSEEGQAEMVEIELNKELILDELNDFEKKRPNEITPALEELLLRIARTGDTLFPWTKVKALIHRKLEIVMSKFYESCPTDDLVSSPNVDVFKYDALKDKILEAVESFQSAPFTIQRICELITSHKKYYKRTDKFMRGLEKNILVVSTIEPSSTRCAEVNNNRNMLVNGVLEASVAVNDLLASPDSNANLSDPISCGSSCMDSTYVHSHSIMNGTMEDNNSPATSSSSIASSSSMMMFGGHHLPAQHESESSSSSDSDSSTDSLSTEYQKDNLLEPAADSATIPSSLQSTPMMQEQTTSYVSSDQPCSSHMPTVLVASSEAGAMDTTTVAAVVNNPVQPEPEEVVSSSDVCPQLSTAIEMQTSLPDEGLIESARILAADSTEGAAPVLRTSEAFTISDATSSVLPESSIVDSGLGLIGDELSVVKEVAENLVETLLSQSVDPSQAVAILPDHFITTATSSTVNTSIEITSLCLNVPDATESFVTEMPVQSSIEEPKLENTDNMDTDFSSLEIQATSSTSSSSPILPDISSPTSSTAPLPPIIEEAMTNLEQTSAQSLPDQSEPMDQDE